MSQWAGPVPAGFFTVHPGIASVTGHLSFVRAARPRPLERRTTPVHVPLCRIRIAQMDGYLGRYLMRAIEGSNIAAVLQDVTPKS